MSRRIWGPKLWYIFHNIAYNYNKIFFKHYKYFYYNIIPKIIPCKMCKINYIGHIKIINMPKLNKNSIITWTLQIHNIVNRELNKNPYFNNTKIYYGINYHIYNWYIEYLINQVKYGYIQRRGLM